MNDVFKFMSSLYLGLYNEHNSDRNNKNKKDKFMIIQEIYGSILGSFDINDIYDFIYKMANNYSIFPNTPNSSVEDFLKAVSGITIDSLIKNIQEMIIKRNINILTKKKPTIVLSCEKSPCLDEEMLEKVLLTRDEPLTIKEAKSLSKRLTEVQEDDISYKKDKKILDIFLKNYMDKLFNKLNTYLNVKPIKDINTIYLFNDLRILENEITKIEEIVKMIDDKEIQQRINMQKEVLYELIKEMYDFADKSLTTYEGRFSKEIYAPEEKKYSTTLKLSSAFQDLERKTKITSKPKSPPKEIKVPIQDIEQLEKELSRTIISEKTKTPQMEPIREGKKEIRITEKSLSPGKAPLLSAPLISIPSTRSSTRPKIALSLPKMEKSLEGSPNTKKTIFKDTLKKYERLMEGKRGSFIKSNLSKTKVQGIAKFIVENKKIVDSDVGLKKEVMDKLISIKNIDESYKDLIDNYLKQLS
jgi:hypothetical protein